MSISQPVRIMREDTSLSQIARAMKESQLGVVLVSRKDDAPNVIGMAALRDYFELYRDEKSMLDSDLTVGDLASSPVLSVRKEDTLRQVIDVMLKYRVRKILIQKTKTVISDRDILSYLTSTVKISQLRKTPELVFSTPAGELPSSRPPFVDNRMSIAAAVQLMNPDTGDCLICNGGLVTFWDLVIKLEASEYPLRHMPSEITNATSASISNSRVRDSDNAILARNSRAQPMELSASKYRRFNQIVKKMEREGFIPFQDVPYFARVRIVDPLYVKHPARPFHIMGVNGGQKGGRKYTSNTLFGRRMLHESYYILDWDRFSRFLSTKLELMFRATNPLPARQLRLAFTRFMHDFGLHWTACHHTA